MDQPKESKLNCSSISTIPYLRDPDFIDTGEWMQEIDAKCSLPASKTVILGSSGIGKTSLVIEYTYRARETVHETSVIWLYAGSAARFEESCSRTVSLLGIADDKAPAGNKFIQLCSWLQAAERGKWILVLDGADNVEICSSTSLLGYPSATNYLESCAKGSVIITTCNKEVMSAFVSSENCIHISHTPVAEDFMLFEILKRKTNREIDEAEHLTATTTMDPLPFSITQAAAFLNYRGVAYSLKQYLDDFRASHARGASKLETQGMYGGYKYEVSTFVPWRLSFDYMFQTRPSAAELLCLASFFDKQGIPEYMLRGQPSSEKAEKLLQTDTDSETSSFTIVDSFEYDVQVLKDLCLITTDSTGKTLEMHRLTQFATQGRLRNHGQLDKWHSVFLARIFAQFPPPQPENWDKCQLLLPHVYAALWRFPAYSDTSVNEWIQLGQNAALFISQTGGFSAAQKIVQLSRYMQTAATHRGDMSYTLLRMKDLMRDLCASIGCWQEAELLGSEGLHQSRILLGQEHLETLRREADLAKVYIQQGRYQDAETGYRKLSSIFERLHGSTDPETLINFSNLSMALTMQERWSEAEAPLQHAIRGSLFILGEGHPATLERMKSLVRIYLAQGKGREWKAESLQRQVVDISRSVFGAEHPSTLDSMNSLIDLQIRSMQWDEAEALQLHVLEAQRKIFGEDHPSTLASMENLVFLCIEQEQWGDAEAVQQVILHRSMEKLGADHYSTQRAMNSLEDIRNNRKPSQQSDSSDRPIKW